MASDKEINKIDIIAQIGSFLKTVKKFKVPMVIGVAVMMIAGYLYAWITYKPVYQSQATFTVSTGESNFVSSGSGESQIEKSFPYILNSDYMKKLVMNDLGLMSFPASIELETNETVELYVLKITSNDAELSYEILNSVIANCPKASIYVLGQISLDVLDTTGVPTTPLNYLDKRMCFVKSGVAGVLVCVLIVFLYTLTNHTIAKEEDLKRYLNVSCLATLPRVSFKKRRKQFDQHIHIHNSKVGHAYLENMRVMRARVQRAMRQKGAKTVLVTSSVPQEGKSTVAANLALSLAEKGSRVILVDLDLRNPSISKVLGEKVNRENGVVDILSGKAKTEQLISGVKKWNLFILFAGEPQNNPQELLKKHSLGRIIEFLKKNYDYVVLDTPPAAMLSDASIVAAYADCAVYVVKQDYTRIERIVEGMDSLTLAQVPIIGVVLNNMEKVGGRYGSNRYGHYDMNPEKSDVTDRMPEYVDVANPWENQE